MTTTKTTLGYFVRKMFIGCESMPDKGGVKYGQK